MCLYTWKKHCRHILLAQENIRNFNKRGVKKFCIKVDVQKAYDRLNRNFICYMLQRMNFPGQIINLIHACLTKPTFSVLINGVPQGMITSNRGTRQEDPLSPYLFCIVHVITIGSSSSTGDNNSTTYNP